MATPSDTVLVYGLTRCDTCVKARKWLDAQGIVHTFIDYRDHLVDADTLRAWAGKVGGWEKLVNRASTTWRSLSDADKATAEEAGWIALIAAHPTLVRRPVLVTPEGQVSVGFKDAAWAARFAG